MLRNRKTPRTLLAIITALLFYTMIDILIWQRIFETDELWQYIGIYHRGWNFALYGFIVLGVLLLDGWREKIFYSLCLYVLCFNGTNDILYYWLDGRAVPARLEWLDNDPFIFFVPVTNTSLIASSSIWILFFVVLWILINMKRSNHVSKETNE
jgi:hypothetical protein